jgi:hypothetical protein
MLFVSVAFGVRAARAAGTATIVQANGHTDVYDDVRIKLLHGTLYMTSAKGQSTMIIRDAACSDQGKLMVCLATHATLIENGTTSLLDFESGTIYANYTDDFQPLVLSTQKVPPHGIILSMTTKRGTYVSLIGRVDVVVK